MAYFRGTVNFRGMVTKTSQRKDLALVSEECLGQVPNLHYFASLPGGKRIKGRVPIMPMSDDERFQPEHFFSYTAPIELNRPPDLAIGPPLPERPFEPSSPPGCPSLPPWHFRVASPTALRLRSLISLRHMTLPTGLSVIPRLLGRRHRQFTCTRHSMNNGTKHSMFPAYFLAPRPKSSMKHGGTATLLPHTVRGLSAPLFGAMEHHFLH